MIASFLFEKRSAIKNGYSSKFFDKCVLKFFNKLYDKRDPLNIVPKLDMMVVVPFLGMTSWKVKKELSRSFNKRLPYCNLKIVFQTKSRLSSCFKFKDSFPKSLSSGVIYKYTCTMCNHSYVGCTKRYWEKRLEEHLHISALTGKPLSGLQVFAPLNHVRSKHLSNRITKDEFSIIGHEKDNYLIKVKESIFIKSMRPNLNGGETSVPLALFSS